MQTTRCAYERAHTHTSTSTHTVMESGERPTPGTHYGHPLALPIDLSLHGVLIVIVEETVVDAASKEIAIVVDLATSLASSHSERTSAVGYHTDDSRTLVLDPFLVFLSFFFFSFFAFCFFFRGELPRRTCMAAAESFYADATAHGQVISTHPGGRHHRGCRRYGLGSCNL